MGGSRLRTTGVHSGALIGIGASVPPIALLLGAGDRAGLAHLEQVSGVVAYSLVLGAAAVTYFHWRVVSSSRAGALDERLAQWLAVGLTAGAVNGVLQVTVNSPRASGVAALCQLGLVLLLCAAAAIADRVDLPGDPVVVCAGAALAIPSAYVALVLFAPPLPRGPLGGLLLNGLVMLASLLMVWVVLGRTKVSLWSRRRLAAATVLLTTAQCVDNTHTDNKVLLAATAAAYLAGALVLSAMAQKMLRRSVLRGEDEIAGLQQTLAEMRAAVLHDRQLLHEVGATLAGIATASRVVQQDHPSTRHRRQRIETMLAAEIARLERLMQQRVAGAAHEDDRLVWIDEVVEPLVISHQARGREVEWEPCGQQAYAEPDELAELCNILLENAARHGGGAPVHLVVAERDGGVHVVCHDDGPGVPPEVRAHIFEAEVKGVDSLGQGLGLAIASRIASSRGGTVDLIDDGRPGATFAAALPAKEMADDRACHVA